MKTKYNVGDVVYWVNDYKIVKSTIEEVVIKKTKDGTKTTYVIASFRKSKDNKLVPCIEAQLVDNFKTAKESAITNWKTISKSVQKQLEDLTDSSFN
jgi:hypothetical protein